MHRFAYCLLRKRESDLFITSLITDRIGRLEVLLPINHKNYKLLSSNIESLFTGKKILDFEESPNLGVSMVIETKLKVMIG